MTFLPSVIRAEYLGGYRIHLIFNDNSEKTIDFPPWLDGPVFDPLKDKEASEAILARSFEARRC